MLILSATILVPGHLCCLRVSTDATLLEKLATRTGFEPVSSAVTGRRNRPDYANEPNLVDPEGIEPNRQPPYILRQRIYSPP